MEAFTITDGASFFRLLLAHLLTNFVLQSNSWERYWRRRGYHSSYFYLYKLCIASISTYVFLGHFGNPWPALTIGVGYTLIDWFKIRYGARGDLQSFLLDQVAKLAFLALIWFMIIDKEGAFFDVIEDIFTDVKVVAILTGYLVCTAPLGILVGMATQKWRQQLANSDALDKAGTWIGVAERVIIFSFVLLDQYEAIGFLIAAKSLLRFNEDKSATKQSEYVLVGTLMSYASAIGVGLLVKLTFVS